MCKPIVPRAPIAAQSPGAPAQQQDGASIDLSDYNGWVSWDAWVVDLYLDNEKDLYHKQYALMDRILAGDLTGVQISRAIADLYCEAYERTRRKEHRRVKLGPAEWVDLADHFLRNLDEYKRWQAEHSHG